MKDDKITVQLNEEKEKKEDEWYKRLSYKIKDFIFTDEKAHIPLSYIIIAFGLILSISILCSIIEHLLHN